MTFRKIRKDYGRCETILTLFHQCKAKEPLNKSFAERVAGKIEMITRRMTQVVAWSTTPRSATQWRPKASPEGPREAGIGQRLAPRPGDYMSLGRSHPATGS